MTDKMTNYFEIYELIERGAIFYVSHSAGKDSQAMYQLITTHVPHDQIVLVHADLGDVEHHGVQDHIRATTWHELNVVAAAKTLFDMVERRFESRPDAPSWPSSATRQCTSDLKRDPIHKFIRQDLKARGLSLAVNCTGIRAEESTSRSKKTPFELNKRLSKAGREVYEWMPIFEWTTQEVFDCIYGAGQQPHQVYLEGNDRLSCVFCIMGSRGDFANGARLRPELLRKYAELEDRTGYTVFKNEGVYDRAGLIRLVEVTA